MTTELAPGQSAPTFTLPRDGGGEVALESLRGQKVVLYFYPKDDTSGCTKEAIAFTGLAADFAAAGVAVLGLSKDPVASHDKFRAKHGLEVILLSDADSDVAECYGVWVEKSMYGRKYMGIERATYLLDEAGAIARIWRKVSVPGHAEQVLEAARSL